MTCRPTHPAPASDARPPSRAQEEAQAQAAKLLANIANGVDVDPSTLTVAEHLRAWLKARMALPPRRLKDTRAR